MPWYPDWVAALDDVANDRPGATVTQRDAENIIRDLTSWRKRAEKAEAELHEMRRAAQGLHLFDR